MTKEETNSWEEELQTLLMDLLLDDKNKLSVRNDTPEALKQFISKLISQEKEKWNESVIKMLEDTDVQMSVNGDVSQDEKAMAKFLYKAHINHIKKKLQKDVSTTSINTDSAKS